MRSIVLVALALGACRPAPPAVTATSPLVVAEVRLEGFDVLPVDARETLGENLPLRAGQPLVEKAEEAAGNLAVEVLQNHGYPYAQVGLAREPIEAGRVRLTLRAEPGTIGFFGPIDIAGNRRVDDVIIRRRVAYEPGDLFRRSAIEASQQRIGALGLFERVEIRAHGIDGHPADVPTLITVEERSPWHWNLGLGYAAGERLGVDARLSHLNFFGSARRLDLQGRVSRIERTAEVGFTQSEGWHPSLGMSLQARHQEIDERSFFVMSRGGQVAVSWQWTPKLSTTGSYAVALERSDVDPSLDRLLGLQDGVLSAWSADLEHRSTGSAARHAVALRVEQAGGWMPGTFNYVSIGGDGRVYHRAAGGPVLVAGRLRYGAIDPSAGDADIPLLKRYFLGGSSEMRGWGIYELSPLSAAGEPVGGKSVLFAAVEARFPIFKRLSGAVFVEAGNVWQDAWALRPGDLFYDAGPGVRLNTPFGLIRIDAGYQLNTLPGLRLGGQPQERRWRFNFGLGEAF